MCLEVVDIAQIETYSLSPVFRSRLIVEIEIQMVVSREMIDRTWANPKNLFLSVRHVPPIHYLIRYLIQKGAIDAQA